MVWHTPRNKSRLMAIAGFIVVAAVVGASVLSAKGAVGQAGQGGGQPSCTNHTVLEVVGTATVWAKPELAQIVLGIETRSQNLSVALQQNVEVSARLASALSGLGVGPRNLTTLSFSVYPVYNDQALEYYEVDNTVEANVSASNAGLVVEAAVEAGVTRVEYVYFTLSPAQLSQLEAQALSQALADAHAKAEQAASQLGLRIVGVKSVSTLFAQNPPPIVLPLTAESTAAGQPPQFYPGQTQYTVSVQVEYLLA